MTRLPKGKPAQIMGSRGFQTMYTAEQMRKAVADEREACAEMVDDMDVQHPKYIAAAIRARGEPEQEPVKRTVMYRPSDLEALGLTHEDVVKLIKEQS